MAQIIVLDKHEVPRAVLGDGPSACPILEDLHDEKLDNAAITYDFTVPADHEDASLIEPEGFVIIRDLDGELQELRVKSVEDDLDATGQRVRKVHCENAALEMNGAIVRPTTFTGTAEQVLSSVLSGSGTRWQVGLVEVAGVKTLKVDRHQTVTETLLQIASTWGGELRWRAERKDGKIVARYVDLLQRRGSATGKRFEYAKDITGLRRVEDTSEVLTAMIGLGKADASGNRLTFASVEWKKANGDPVDKPMGIDWVGDPDALARWGLPDGRHLYGVYDDSEEENPAALLQKTWAALQTKIQSRFTYEVDVATLERIAGYEHERVRLGDTVTVEDVTMQPPLVVEARVIETQRSYVDPSKDKAVLGYFRPLITSLPTVIADLQRRLSVIAASTAQPVAEGPTPPENPSDGALWLNTAQVPNVLYRYDASSGQWVKATPTQPGEVGAEKAVVKSATIPPNPQVGDLWLNTAQTPNVLLRKTEATPPESRPTLQVGSTGPAVVELQDALKLLGYNPGPSDGVFGSQVQAAVQAFQTDAGLSATGVVDTATWTALDQRGALNWVRATPTWATEVGAETPGDAQQKANQAEANAKQAVASGQVPLPTSALSGAIDAALNLIKASQGYVYMDGQGLVVYDKPADQNPTKAVKIASGGIAIASAKDANGNWVWRTALTGDGIVADEVRAGTMLFDRVRGGTAELGGSGNGSGLLIVRDGSGAEVARMDSAGVRVSRGSFLLQDASGVTESIVALTNFVRDHSFEMIPRTGSADANMTYAIDQTALGNQYWWRIGGSNPSLARVYSTYGSDAEFGALFDFQAAVVGYYGDYWWEQYLQLDAVAGLAGPYTASVWFAAFPGTAAATNGVIEVHAFNGTSLTLVGSAMVAISPSEWFVWKRAVVTVRNLPSDTIALVVRLLTSPSAYVLADGVQVVASPYPAVYNPESALWRSLRGLAGYRNVEAGSGVPGIRLTRNTAYGISSSVYTPVPWGAVRPGYSSANFTWSTADPAKVYCNLPGYYVAIANVMWATGGNSGSYRNLVIRKNGAAYIARIRDQYTGVPVYHSVSTFVQMAAGDYLEVVVAQDSGTTINLSKEDYDSPEFMVVRIG